MREMDLFPGKDKDEPLGFAAIGRDIPPRGVVFSTVYRWHKKGRHGVRLEAVEVGRQLMTTRRAVNRFFNESTEAGRQTKVLK